VAFLLTPLTLVCSRQAHCSPYAQSSGSSYRRADIRHRKRDLPKASVVGSWIRFFSRCCVSFYYWLGALVRCYCRCVQTQREPPTQDSYSYSLTCWVLRVHRSWAGWAHRRLSLVLLMLRISYSTALRVRHPFDPPIRHARLDTQRAFGLHRRAVGFVFELDDMLYETLIPDGVRKKYEEREVRPTSPLSPHVPSGSKIVTLCASWLLKPPDTIMARFYTAAWPVACADAWLTYAIDVSYSLYSYNLYTFAPPTNWHYHNCALGLASNPGLAVASQHCSADV
jgi:hypothetical protein